MTIYLSRSLGVCMGGGGGVERQRMDGAGSTGCSVCEGEWRSTRGSL